MNNCFCIYVFSDEGGVPKYVGKTKHLHTRIKQHLKDRHKRKSYFYNWLNKQISEDKEFYIDVLELVNEDNWKEREKYWIKHIQENNYRLTNMTEGGDGNSIQLIGVIPKCVELAKKPILQYDLDGNFIKEWKSITEAAIAVETSTSCISRAAKGKEKYANKFQWRYKETNYPLKIESCNSKLTRINQYSLVGEFIKEWESGISIAEYFNVNRNTIYDVLRKKKKTYKGFIWERISR